MRKNNKKLEVFLDLLDQELLKQLRAKTGKTDKEVIKYALSIFHQFINNEYKVPVYIQPIQVPIYPRITDPAPIVNPPTFIPYTPPVYPYVPMEPLPWDIDPLYVGDVLPDPHITTCQAQS